MTNANTPAPRCEAGCTDTCKAKEHGCASECPSPFGVGRPSPSEAARPPVAQLPVARPTLTINQYLIEELVKDVEWAREWIWDKIGRGATPGIVERLRRDIVWLNGLKPLADVPLYAAPVASPATREDDATRILRRILFELPSRRDWLDPDLELEAIAAVTALRGDKQPEGGAAGLTAEQVLALDWAEQSPTPGVVHPRYLKILAAAIRSSNLEAGVLRVALLECQTWLFGERRKCKSETLWDLDCSVRAALSPQGNASTGGGRSCGWLEDSDGTWNTQCGQAFQFNDDGPAENGFTFCQGCGKKIDTEKYIDPEATTTKGGEDAA